MTLNNQRNLREKEDLKRMADKRFIFLFLLFIFIKIGYLILHYSLSYPNFNRIPKDAKDANWHVFANNDSGWYHAIAMNGYSTIESIKDSDAANYAFFPLFPLLIKAVMHLTSWNALHSMVVVSQLISILLLWLLYLFIKTYCKSQEIALYSTLIWLVFPHHYYFSMAYTESLFLCLALASFYALLKRNTTLFIISSCLLVLTRVNGFFILLPLFLFEFQLKKLFKLKSLLKFIPMIISLLAYLFFLYIKTGDFLAFKHASEFHWNGTPQNPLQTLVKYLFDWNQEWYLNYNAFYALFFIGLSWLFLKRREYAFFTLAIVTILIPLYEGSTISQPRFISVIFPFAILLNHILKNRSVKIAMIIFFLIGHYSTFWFWMINHPFSF